MIHRLRVRIVSTTPSSTAIATTAPGEPRSVNAFSACSEKVVACAWAHSATLRSSGRPGRPAHERRQHGERETAGDEHDQRERQRQSGRGLGVGPPREPREPRTSRDRPPRLPRRRDARPRSAGRARRPAERRGGDGQADEAADEDQEDDGHLRTSRTGYPGFRSIDEEGRAAMNAST